MGAVPDAADGAAGDAYAALSQTQAQADAPATQLVGQFVRYGSAQGDLVRTDKGLYVVDTRSNENVRVEGAESGQPAQALGLEPMVLPVVSVQTRPVAPARGGRAVAGPVAVVPAGPAPTAQAMAGGRAMHAGPQRPGAQAAQQARLEAQFHEAVDLLAQEYGNEAAGYILSQIEAKLGRPSSTHMPPFGRFGEGEPHINQ